MNLFDNEKKQIVLNGNYDIHLSLNIYYNNLKFINLDDHSFIDMSEIKVKSLELECSNSKIILPLSLEKLVLLDCKKDNDLDLLNNLPNKLNYLQIEYYNAYNKEKEGTKKMKFKNDAQILNFMDANGWEFVSASGNTNMNLIFRKKE